MRIAHAAGMTLLGFILSSSIASAQTTGTFAVGGNFRVLESQAADASGGASPGFLWRWGRPTTGWGVNYGLNWYNTDLQTPIGSRTTTLGDLRARPFLAGYGYKRVFGAYSVTLDAIGGFSINSFKLDPRATDALYTRLGARAVDASVSNSFVLKPEVTIWKDLSPKVGLQINAGYLFNRPTLTLRSSLGVDRRRYKADMLVLQIGAVYSIF